MIQSMTGFGRAEKGGCRVEVKSVNHRYLDVSMKSPSFLGHLEIPFRKILKENFARGKFDISVFVTEHDASEMTINIAYVKKIYHEIATLQQELRIGGEVDINSLLSLHDMFVEVSPKFDAEAVTEVFREALADLSEMRMSEGLALEREIRGMTDALVSMTSRIRAKTEKMVMDVREKFSERLGSLLNGAEIDDSRVLQEAAIIAARMDIAEELARIDSHIAQIGSVLDAGGTIGRKLDFLLQEFNREVNTVASKSSDFEVSSVMVEMKTGIEKIREQVQNIQ